MNMNISKSFFTPSKFTISHFESMLGIDTKWLNSIEIP